MAWLILQDVATASLGITPQAAAALDLPEVFVSKPHLLKLRAMHFPDDAFRVDFDVYTAVDDGEGGWNEGTKMDEQLSFSILAEAQPPIPPEDVLDDDDNVVIAAGEHFAGIPAWDVFRQMPVPQVIIDAMANGMLLGEFIDEVEHCGYILSGQLNPDKWNTPA